MSEVNKEFDKVWSAPLFHKAGRLPTDKLVISDSYDRKHLEETLFRQGRNEKGQEQGAECGKSLRVHSSVCGQQKKDTSE